MILILVPLVMIAVGWALGGRLHALQALPIRWGALPLAAFGIQWLLVRVPGADPRPLLGAAFAASYGLLIAFLLLNRRLPGLKLALVGTLLNLAAILANGGFMPIAPATFAAVYPDRPAPVAGQRIPQSKDVLLPADQASLPGLGDTLVLTWPFRSVFSIGDLVLAAGLGTLILVGMQPGRLRRRRAAQRPAGSRTLGA
jgi:hypothetical protein